MPIEHQIRIAEADITSASLTLEAPADEAYIIQDISFSGGSANGVASVNLGGTNLFNMRTSDSVATISPTPNFEDYGVKILSYLREKFSAVPPLKLLAGKTFTVTGDASCDLCHVAYSVVTGQDIPKATDDGAHRGNKYLFISDGITTKSIAGSSSEAFTMDTANNPEGVTTFPFEKPCPSKYKMHWLGFCVAKGNGHHADIAAVTIRAWLDEVSILAKDQAWVDFRHFPFPNSGSQSRPFLWKSPITIQEGSLLETEIYATNGNVGAQNAEIIVNHIFLAERI